MISAVSEGFESEKQKTKHYKVSVAVVSVERAQEKGRQGGSHSHVPEGGRSLCLWYVFSRARKGPLSLQLFQLWPSEVASLTPASSERLAAQPPRPSPGLLPAQTAQQCGQCGLGHGEWEPLFVSTEKVLTSFQSHRHGNRPQRSLNGDSFPPVFPSAFLHPEAEAGRGFLQPGFLCRSMQI